ncbi:serine protein kinase PrkA [Geotalea sp. SG265]|uniref:serine protein kinase PrkA n=1 Tax=Geotalea sp. SG265 TaxID=2922867 RepID=UPI001FAFFD90|nr:serine protein kinase PrkA [Geotalea sp. SG265]
MTDIRQALQHIKGSVSSWDQREPLSFEEFLQLLAARPEQLVRNIFQVFHDMIVSHVTEKADEYPEDPESIHYVSYDCSRLFVKNADHPFFADRLFANRLINLVESWRRGAQQNKIYIFEGPPGSGKSTFLNRLLMKFEEYANSEEGLRFETVWRLDRQRFGGIPRHETSHFLDRLSKLIDEYEFDQNQIIEAQASLQERGDDYVEVVCPSHDNPILMIPKDFRRQFFLDLFGGDEAKLRLLDEKAYEWVFRTQPCTICSSIYLALLRKLKDPAEVLKMVYAYPYRFNRRLGEGISVFSPGDKPMKHLVFGNDMLQNRINSLLRDSNQVNYIFSQYAKTNNGIYALMDIKSHNTDRLMELHNIISEGVHKVEDLEENVNSLFIALMNPEDKKNIENFPSFSDRIQYIKIPYVLDLNTEVEIYRNIFGRQIDDSFLPRVLHAFARIIIATRLHRDSEAMREWIVNPQKYAMFCDENLLLLKMEIYTGYIPPWLDEEDRKRLTAKRRRKIIAESELEGDSGFSGRDAINIFNDFYSTYARKDALINMSVLVNYFTRVRPDLGNLVPEGFTDALLRLYAYTVLQEVKESLYYYNEEQISREIRNYLFAVNFEPGRTETCRFTGDKLQISDQFFEGIETKLLGPKMEQEARLAFRSQTQKEYTARTLTQEILAEGKDITRTALFQELRERYIFNLKEKALDPFLENANFRRAIKDYSRPEFRTYDKKIRNDVTFLINNLCSKFRYTKNGAREVCLYVIDTDLARRFARNTESTQEAVLTSD